MTNNSFLRFIHCQIYSFYQCSLNLKYCFLRQLCRLFCTRFAYGHISTYTNLVEKCAKQTSQARSKNNDARWPLDSRFPPDPSDKSPIQHLPTIVHLPNFTCMLFRPLLLIPVKQVLQEASGFVHFTSQRGPFFAVFKN